MQFKYGMQLEIVVPYRVNVCLYLSVILVHLICDALHFFSFIVRWQIECMSVRWVYVFEFEWTSICKIVCLIIMIKCLNKFKLNENRKIIMILISLYLLSIVILILFYIYKLKMFFNFIPQIIFIIRESIRQKKIMLVQVLLRDS